MRILVCGPEERSRGLTGCYIAPRPNSIDHKRLHKIHTATGQAQNLKLPVWDFVVMREDGTAVRLNPPRSHTKVECCALNGPSETIHPPPRGLGQSWVRGTYRWYMDHQTMQSLKFDPSKGKGLYPQYHQA